MTPEPPPGLSRRSLLGAAVTSTLLGAAAGTSLRSSGSGAAAGTRLGPFRLVVDQHDVRVDRSTPAELKSAMASGAIEPFTMLGLSAGDASRAARLGEIRYSVRGADGWLEWSAVPYAVDEGPDGEEAGTVRASPPIWVDSCDGLRLDVPADLAGHVTVHLVRETPTVLATHSDIAPVVSKAPRPTIRPRSQWGARPARKITYNSEMKLAIVHHTAGANGYSAGQVPGIIAGIQRFHMDANQWDDIAYNFLVDRFGRIWEGREGGTTRIVRGGHTAGFNTSNTGIAVLGDRNTSGPAAAEVNAVAVLVGWKLGIHGRDVSGTIPYTAGTGAKRPDFPPGTTKRVPVLTMHGDLGVTSCPGSSLRSRIPAIRQAAYSAQIGMRDVAVTAYYAAPVSWLVRNGITTGVGGSDLYKPDASVTRAEMATFLYRLVGDGRTYPHHGFPDVPAGVYYDKPVRWLKAMGITTGVGASGRFEPNLVVSRAQMVTFLHRTTGSKAPSRRHSFPDVRRDVYYDRPVSWAAEHRITTGYANTGRFEPDRPVSRGEMSAFLHRTATRSAAWATGPSDPP